MARRLLTLPAALLLALSCGQPSARAAPLADGADVRQWTWLDNGCRQWRPNPA
ncbi:hypothetical protein [Streptomyces viridosporus]|uniref:hypothetical protein n=1 Tax=Streptomyces viridosporus TaxID=67581 RepID=UPI00135CB595|nr:hypothetical protein [Streptomyces viridosporus]